MKHLTIIYNPGTGPVQLYDGPVEELSWLDSESVVRVDGRLKKAAQSGAGLLDLISSASKKKTIAKKAELEATE